MKIINFIWNLVGFLLGLLWIGLNLWSHHGELVWAFVIGIGWFLFVKDLFNL